MMTLGALDCGMFILLDMGTNLINPLRSLSFWGRFLLFLVSRSNKSRTPENFCCSIGHFPCFPGQEVDFDTGEQGPWVETAKWELKTCPCGGTTPGHQSSELGIFTVDCNKAEPSYTNRSNLPTVGEQRTGTSFCDRA